VKTIVALYVSGSFAAIVEGAVDALTFAPVAFALTLAVELVLMLVFSFAPLVHATATTAIAKRSIKTGCLTSVFFIVAFSEGSTLAREVVFVRGGCREGLKDSTRWAKAGTYDLGVY
jgi:hypothetical protein